MNSDTPKPILAITVTANKDRHRVLVQLGAQTLALAPEAAHALAAALSTAATELCPIAAERPKIEAEAAQAGLAADLLITTIDVLIGRYRQGTLMPPLPDSKPRPEAAPMALPAQVNVQGGASISASKE